MLPVVAVRTKRTHGHAKEVLTCECNQCADTIHRGQCISGHKMSSLLMVGRGAWGGLLHCNAQNHFVRKARVASGASLPQ